MRLKTRKTQHSLTDKTNLFDTKTKVSYNFAIEKLFWFISIQTLASCSYVQPSSYEFPLSNDPLKSQFMKIRLLGSLGFKSIKLQGIRVTELSGISWDNDQQLMYAVSDEGDLFHFKLNLDNNHLNHMQLVYATHLKDKKGRALRGKYSDAEGLSLADGNNGKKMDSQLIIAFENEPRIARYSVKGEFVSEEKIPHKLNVKQNYRSKNKALESVTLHPQYGVLTASEFPLKNHKINHQSIYSASGKKWHFPASPSKNSAITGLETMPNGDLLVMERAWRNIFTPIVINLRQLHLQNCNKKNECLTSQIASFSGADGWILDNFEGLTHVEGNRYLMISDNNGNPFQNTILVYFEILESGLSAHSK